MVVIFHHIDTIRRGDDQHGGVDDVRLDQRSGSQRIAAGYGDPLLAQRLDPFPVLFRDNERDAGFSPSTRAVAGPHDRNPHEDHLPLQVLALRLHR